MEDLQRGFKIGDQVIHWSYGPGVIIELDEKELGGHLDQYYVVQLRDMSLWVPVSQAKEQGLRYPTPAEDFQRLFDILASPGEMLSDDRWDRKNQLAERMKTNSLDAICRVVRDILHYKRLKKLNDHDTAIFERAKTFLLNEWSISLSVPMEEAEQKLFALVGGNPPAVKSR